MEPPTNLFTNLPPHAPAAPQAAGSESRGLPVPQPGHTPDEFFELLAASPAVRIARIVSHGHASPDGFWYDQDTHEWVTVLRGTARLRFADGAVHHLTPGDVLDIPAHARHRVDWTTPDEPTIWLAVYYA